MHFHCGPNNRAPRWTFTDPCKPEVRAGAREESASPAWVAAPALTKTKILKINTKSNGQVLLDTATIEEVSDFVYLGNKITSAGNSEVEVLARIGKATGAFASLRDIWR